MLLTYYTWIKAVKTGSIYWAAMCALAYFYMVSAPSPAASPCQGRENLHRGLRSAPLTATGGVRGEGFMSGGAKSGAAGGSRGRPSESRRKSNLRCAARSVPELFWWGGFVLFVCFLSWQVSSWGGYVFLINLIPLHVLVLMLTGRFSHRIYVAYCTVYCLGTILSMQISFVGFQVGDQDPLRAQGWSVGGAAAEPAASRRPRSPLAFAAEVVSGRWLPLRPVAGLEE